MRPLSLLAALALGACALGPEPLPAPPAPPAAFDAATGAGPVSGAPADPRLLAHWWTRFDDPILNRLVARAVESNLNVAQALARVRAARAERAIAAGEAAPQVDASARASRYRVSENLPGFGVTGPTGGESEDNGLGIGAPGSEVNSFQLGFDASWEADIFGRNAGRIAAADARINAQVASARDALVSLLGELARDYVALREAQRRRQVARTSLGTQRGTLALTQELAREGLGSELDVARAAAQVAETEASLPGFDSEAQRAIYRLGVLTGSPPAALEPQLAPPRPIPAAGARVAIGAPADLLRRRPDVAAAEARLMAAAYEVGVARADLYPALRLTGSVGLLSGEVDTLFDPASFFYSIAANLLAPIFDGGRREAQVELRRAQVEESFAAYRQTVLTALRDVEDAATQYSAAITRRRDLARATADSARALAFTQERFREGLIPFLDVLQAQADLARRQDALAAAEAGVASTLTALYKALGGGWETTQPATLASNPPPEASATR